METRLNVYNKQISVLVRDICKFFGTYANNQVYFFFNVLLFNETESSKGQETTGGDDPGKYA